MALDLHRVQQSEVTNTSRVDFWRDGEVFCAFERSAWFVATWLSPGRAFRKLQSEAGPVACITLSAEEMQELIEPYKDVMRTEEKVMVRARVAFDINAYYKWKNHVELHRAALGGEVQQSSPEELRLRREELWQRVKSFDYAHASNAQCREFVGIIKEIVEK